MTRQAYEFTFDVAQATTLLAAISNHQRLRIVMMLMEGEREVGSISTELKLSQSAASQHLRKLRDAHIVRTRRAAQLVFYSLASTDAERVIRAVGLSLAVSASQDGGRHH